MQEVSNGTVTDEFVGVSADKSGESVEIEGIDTDSEDSTGDVEAFLENPEAISSQQMKSAEILNKVIYLVFDGESDDLTERIEQSEAHGWSTLTALMKTVILSKKEVEAAGGDPFQVVWKRVNKDPVIMGWCAEEAVRKIKWAVTQIGVTCRIVVEKPDKDGKLVQKSIKEDILVDITFTMA